MCLFEHITSKQHWGARIKMTIHVYLISTSYIKLLFICHKSRHIAARVVMMRVPMPTAGILTSYRSRARVMDARGGRRAYSAHEDAENNKEDDITNSIITPPEDQTCATCCDVQIRFVQYGRRSTICDDAGRCDMNSHLLC